jgi:hypothetical protein
MQIVILCVKYSQVSMFSQYFLGINLIVTQLLQAFHFKKTCQYVQSILVIDDTSFFIY